MSRNTYWARAGSIADPRPGQRRNYVGGGYLRELRRGWVVDSAVFRLDPLPSSRPRPYDVRSIYVQIRTGVELESNNPALPEGRRRSVQRDQIAIAGWGGHPERYYTWVQIYSDEPEQVTRADGSTRAEDLGWNEDPAMERSHDIVRVERTTQFQSFLIERTREPGGGFGRLPRYPAVAAVAWSRETRCSFGMSLRALPSSRRAAIASTTSSRTPCVPCS